jgi:hypothetical protein
MLALAIVGCGNFSKQAGKNDFVRTEQASDSLFTSCVATLRNRNGATDAAAAQGQVLFYGQRGGPESTAITAPGIYGCVISPEQANDRLRFLDGQLDGAGLTPSKIGRQCRAMIINYKAAYNMRAALINAKLINKSCDEGYGRPGYNYKSQAQE